MVTPSRDPKVAGSRKPSRYVLVLFHLTGESVLLADSTWGALGEMHYPPAARPAVRLFPSQRAALAVRDSFHGWAAFITVVPV
jgi:hypothetical protein